MIEKIKKSKVWIFIALLLVVLFISALSLLPAINSEVRKELEFSVYNYMFMTRVAKSDIASISETTNFRIPLREGSVPYLATLSNNKEVYIVVDSINNRMAALLSKEYDMILGMIEQGKI